MSEKTPKTFIAEVHNSGEKIRLTIGKDEVVLDTYELETVIRTLADRRAMMTEPVPMELEPNAGVNPLINPPAVVGDTAVGEKLGKTQLAIIGYRHPGYGWQSIAFTAEAAKGIRDGIDQVLKKIDPMGTAGSKLILPGQ